MFSRGLERKPRNSLEQVKRQEVFCHDNHKRRRRWWRVLTELDPSMALSDVLRMELMLELSGLSRQEVLVVKACAATKDFEAVAKVLVDQDSGIHLREGSKSWIGRTYTPQSGKPGKGYGNSKGSYGGKGLGSYKTAYAAYLDWEGMDEGADGEYEEYYEEDAPYTGLLGGIEESPLTYELHDDIDDKFETTALNALVDLSEADHYPASAGGFHCLQSCQGKG